MDLKELIQHLDTERVLLPDTEAIKLMHYYSGEAIRLTSELNTGYHTEEEKQRYIEEITGKPVENLGLFPPFYTDFGKNLTIGKNVFINAACQFQDQGGITIGDDTHIGPKVVVATINHGLKAKDRLILHLAPVHIGKNVWIGASTVILPGVTIGDNAVIGAGSVVRTDVPKDTVYAGVPAKFIKEIDNSND